MGRGQIVHHGHAYESINAQSFAEGAHANQLRERILNKIPGLCVTKSGRQVTLTVDGEVRRAMLEACAWPDKEKKRVLNKAAKYCVKICLSVMRFLMVMFQKNIKVILSLTLWSS